MSERATPQEILKAQSHRSVLVDGKGREYEISKSEVLLEQLCSSFGTRLGQARAFQDYSGFTLETS